MDDYDIDSQIEKTLDADLERIDALMEEHLRLQRMEKYFEKVLAGRKTKKT